MQMLFKVSYRIVNDEEAAEDLAHDSLIKANEKNLTFPSINDAKYWLIRVVKNASINYIKRKDRERKAYEKVLYEDHRKADTGLNNFYVDSIVENRFNEYFGFTDEEVRAMLACYGVESR